MSLTDIKQLLPKDVYDAAIGANSPSAANVFATMADVGGGGGSVGGNNYNISDGAGGFQLGLLQNATGTQIAPTSNANIALGTNSLRFSQVRASVFYAYGTGGGSQNIRIQTGTTNPTFHGVDTSSGSDVGGLAIGSNQNVYVKFIDESTGGLKRGLLIQDTYTTGTTAIRSLTMDASAVLDLSSTERGILIPRLTFAQQTAIAAPANGLQVHIEDGTDSVPYYNHSVDGWVPVGRYAGANVTTGTGSLTYGIVQTADPGGKLIGGNLRANSTVVTPLNQTTGAVWDARIDLGSAAAKFRDLYARRVRLYGGGWGVLFDDGDGVISGTNSQTIVFSKNSQYYASLTKATSEIGFMLYDDSPASAKTIDASAILELESTSRGFLPPRMTTVQMNAIATPATGLMIYDTTTNQWMGYDGTSWVIIA